MERRESWALPRGFGPWAAVAVCAALGAALFAFVDLRPKVQADFFFSTDDPQFQSSLQIEREFGASPQIFVVARAPRLVSGTYLRRVHELTRDLARAPGVLDARSVTHGPKEPEEVLEDEPQDVFEDLAESPFWSGLLMAPDRSATFVVLRLDERLDHAAAVRAIDRVMDRHSRPDFQLGASGVPYVAEHIRTRLGGDLRTFSILAFAAFAALIALLFRSVPVLLGMMTAALTASFATFLVRALAGMETDILAPNLWTIAFVLTLSHTVYLTAAWRREARKVGAERAARESVRLTGPASAWALVANLLGFATLIFVSAKPLRQFGISGAIAALAAMACAYLLFPPFLRAADPGGGGRSPLGERLERFFSSRHRIVAVSTIAAALVLGPFAWRVDTDPSLPSYFSSGDRIHEGIRAIDRAGGSSPLDVVVADSGERPLDDDEAFERLRSVQARLEEHGEVGSVISIAQLMAEADRPWYSFLFSWETRLDRLDSPEHGQVGRTFISEDRRHGRFILRMREEARSRPREEIVAEIEGIVREAGFEPVLVGGLYPLQGELSELVQGSVMRGLGGLLACFFLITLVVTRSPVDALAMVLCLAATPLILFGLVGLAGMPLDIISAPAANVALPLGIDEMIHLGYAVRRHRGGGGKSWAAWQKALSQMWLPILYSMLIVASGFALFLFSSSPPTRRLGILVSAGAVLTDLMVLVVLPAVVTLAHRWGRKHRAETGAASDERTAA